MRWLIHTSEGLGDRIGLEHVREEGCGKAWAVFVVHEITKRFLLVSNVHYRVLQLFDPDKTSCPFWILDFVRTFTEASYMLSWRET